MESNNSKGIVLLGHPRSGTTLTRRLLNGHSRIASPPETHLLSACGRFLESERTHSGLDIGALSGLNFAGINDEAVLAKLRDFAFSFLDDYAAREGKQRWAEKTAFDAFHIKNIEQFIGNHAQFVGIVRHPLDVAMSCIKFCESMGFYPKDLHKYIAQYPHPIEAFAHSWLDVSRDLISLSEKHPEHCKIYRYEDIVGNAESTMSDLLNFIGEDFELTMLTEGLSSEQNVGFGDHKSYQAKQVHNDSIGKWSSIPDYQQQKLAPLLNPMLERLGYPLIEQKAEISVAQAREQYSSSMKIVAQRTFNATQSQAEIVAQPSVANQPVIDIPRISVYGHATSNRENTSSIHSFALEDSSAKEILGFNEQADICFVTLLISLIHRIGEDNHLDLIYCKTTEKAQQNIPVKVLASQDLTFSALLSECKKIVEDKLDQSNTALTPNADIVLHCYNQVALFEQALAKMTEASSVLSANGQSCPALVLSVLIDQASEEIKLVFEFNDAVWLDEKSKKQTIAHFNLMLDAFVEDERQNIESFSLLTPQEQALLPGDQAFDVLPDSVIEQFIHQVKSRPDHRAIVCGEQTVSYQELGRRVLLLSALLQENGVSENHIVAVCLDRSINLVTALLAVMHAGGTYVPLDPDHPQSRIAQILEDAEPQFILSEQHLLNKLATQPSEKIHLLNDELWQNQCDRALEFEQLAELAYIIFTSGSTGRPKGVQVYQNGLSTFLVAMAERPGMNKDDRLLSVTTVSFDIAALEIFLPLTLGATLFLAKREDTMNGLVLQQIMADNQITFFQATPATYHILLANEWPGSANLTLLCGGEAMPPELAEGLLDRCESLWNMYGPTETTIWSTVKKVEKAQALMPIGTAIRGTQTYVLNDKQAKVPLGVAGELYIAGEGVAKGYHHRDEQTKERFVDDVFSPKADAKMYRTGDLVKRLGDGDLVYLGRLDNQVKIRGYRIELGDIEAAIKALPATKQCVVSVFELNSRSKSLVAYIITESGNEQIDITALKTCLKPILPEYMIPSFVVHLDEFPLTPNNKVDRKALPAPRNDVAQRPDTTHQKIAKDIVNRDTADSQAEDLLATITTSWQRILGITNIRPEDSFVALGGDSLSFVQITIELEKVLGQLPDGWENQSILALATSANSGDATSALMAQSSTTADPVTSEDVNKAASSAEKLITLSSAIDTTIFVRAFAMLSVVFMHTFSHWGIKGNTSILFMVAGLLFAKFQLQQVFSTASVKPILTSAWRIFLPSTLIMGAWLWWNDIYMLDTLLLFSNLSGTHITNFGYYWYIQVLLQLLFIFVLLFSLESIRQFAQSEPFKFGLAMLALSFVSFLIFLATLPGDFNLHRLPALPLWYFMIGWCIYFADTSLKRVVTAHIIGVFAVLYFFLLYRADLSLAQPLLIVIAGILLITQTKITLIKPLNTLCYMLASSSLFVYLVHMPIIQTLPELISIHDTLDKFIAISASLVVGYAFWWLWEQLTQQFKKSN